MSNDITIEKTIDYSAPVTLTASGEAAKEDAEHNKYDDADVPLKKLVPFGNKSLYGYIILTGIGIILAGQGFSTNSVLLGHSVDIFLKYEYKIRYNNRTNLMDEENDFMVIVYNLFIVSLVFSFIALIGTYVLLYYTQLSMIVLSKKMREVYFRNIVRMDIAWHDKQNIGEFASRIATDFKRFENGLNENVGVFLFHSAAGILNLVASFFYGWKLTLAIVIVLPVVIIAALLITKFASFYMTKEARANNVAGAAVEEAIFSIRTVFAFGAQKHEMLRYEKKLEPGLVNAYKRHVASAFASGINWMMTYIGVGISLYVGIKLTLDDSSYTPGNVVIVYWCINGCAYNISCAAPHYEALQIGRNALKSIFKVLDSVSAIDPNSGSGLKLAKGFKADIEFKNVTFAYPTRPGVTVLRDLSLRINEGEVVALVGASGSGKSTIIQLIQRFYDPLSGEISINGVSLKDLNVGWLREHIGLVGQEPVLFSDTIEGNIRLGLPSEQMNIASMERVVMSGKMANAHEFVSVLKDGYGTYVGDRGAQLSGGQKQRIAIARALISDPRILLLDEATSALDMKSEIVVQEALDRAALGRTTIIVAHRLSTIANADRIVVFEKGQIVEMGTHSALMAKKGSYFNLVNTQQLALPEAKSVPFNINVKPPHTARDDEDEEDVTRVEPQQHLPASGAPSIRRNAKLPNVWYEFEKKAPTFPYKRIFRMMWKDKWMLMTAVACSFGFGFIIPLYAVLIGDFIDEYRNVHKAMDREYMTGKAILYLTLYTIMGIVAGVLCVVQITFFGIVGENLTKRLRILAYGSVLSQEISWFDQPTNSTGRICSKLADDASNIQAATGLRVSMICQATSTMMSSMIVGFFFSWRLALFSLLIMPFVIAVGFMSANINAVQNQSSSRSVQKTVKILVEVVNSMRTVASLHKEEYFVQLYVKQLMFHSSFVRTTITYKSVMMALALTSELFAYTLSFLAGGYVMTFSGTRSGDFFRVVESMIFGAAVIGECAILSTDFIRAKLAALSIFNLIDSCPANSKLLKSYEDLIPKDTLKVECIRKDNSNSDEDDGSAEHEKAKGNVEFKGVGFSYPSRPEQTILNGLSFAAHTGQTIALVGASGCGKSTTIQLLEQFYEPLYGEIRLDGKDIQRCNRDWVRKQMALVSQEPSLFNYSIAQNIAYGDITRSVSMGEIVRVSKMANVDEFIKNMPKGYDTVVGSKGTQLSGGQKQRIAIARALIRDPPILLLDEATSALDSASEAIVQKALEEASRGRTCLVIAHRLRTIQNAQKIVVFNQGVVVEEGTHEELLNKHGYYFALYTAAFAKR